MESASQSARKPFATPGIAGSVRPRKLSGNAVFKSGGAKDFDRRDGLHQSLGRIAGFRGENKTRGFGIQACKRARKRARIEIVIEAHAGAVPAIAVVTGDAPATKLRQRLPA